MKKEILSPLHRVQLAKVIAHNDQRIEQLRKIYCNFYNVSISTVKLDNQGSTCTCSIDLTPGERDHELFRMAFDQMLNDLVAETMAMRNSMAQDTLQPTEV